MEPFHADWFEQYKYDSNIDNYSTRFEISNNSSSIRFEMKKHYSHSTTQYVRLCPQTGIPTIPRSPCIFRMSLSVCLTDYNNDDIKQCWSASSANKLSMKLGQTSTVN